MTTFNHLPFELIEKILLYARGYTPALRMVSQRWKDITSSHRFNNVAELCQLAYEGHIELLTWIHNNHNGMFCDEFNEILTGATAGGHESICHLAEEWGADSVDYMLIVATKHNHENLCRLAEEWGATDFDWMLIVATKHNHENLCRLAKEWGATNFDEMLIVATEHNHENLCRLAKEWGADCVDCMIIVATKHNHENLCRLAKEWGATDFGRLLSRAA